MLFVHSAGVQIAFALEREKLVGRRSIGDQVDLPPRRRMPADPELLFAGEFDLDAGSDPVALVPKDVGSELLERVKWVPCR